MTENIVGIKPVEPGFVSFDVVPHLVPPLLRVSGHVATPLGPVTAAHDYQLGCVTITAPDAATYRLGISKTARALLSVARVQDGVSTIVWPTATRGIEDRGDMLLFHGLRGDAMCTLTFGDTAVAVAASPQFPGPTPPFPPWDDAMCGVGDVIAGRTTRRSSRVWMCGRRATGLAVCGMFIVPA